MIKYFILTLLLIIFALLQSSFFVHFAIAGQEPNFIFILFFIFIFLLYKKEAQVSAGQIFAGCLAGLLSDVIGGIAFGVSIIFFIAISFFVNKSLFMLKDQPQPLSFFYFIPLFIISFLAYYCFADVSVDFWKVFGAESIFNWGIIVSTAYNTLIAFIGFYICKKINLYSPENRQLNLFK